MGLTRITMPPRIQLLAVLAFGVLMLLIENQIQKLNESRAKLGKTTVIVTVHMSVLFHVCIQTVRGVKAIIRYRLDSHAG